MATSGSGLTRCTPQRGAEEWPTGEGRQEDPSFRNLPPRTSLTFKKATCTLKTRGNVSALKCGHSQLVSIYLSLQSKSWAFGYSVDLLFPYKAGRVAQQGHYCGWEGGPSLIPAAQSSPWGQVPPHWVSGPGSCVPITALWCCGCMADTWMEQGRTTAGAPRTGWGSTPCSLGPADPRP